MQELASIPTALTLTSAPLIKGLCQGLEQEFEDLLMLKLSQVLHTLSPTDAERLLTEMDRLNDRRIKRVLTAPDTVFHLLSQTNEDQTELVRFLVRCFKAENAVKSGAALMPGYWTALGDRGADKHGEPITAKTLEDGLILDGQSPNARRPLQQSSFREIQLGQPEALSDTDRQAAEAAIQRAATAMQAACPAAYALVCRSLKTIVIRKDSNFEGAFTSSSSRLFVGRALLINPFLKGLSTAKLSGALLHEAIHSLLYRLETVSALTRTRAPDTEPPVLVSPWSGSRLSLHTYIHACYVYFALNSYFEHALGAGVIGEQELLDQLHFIRRGFEDEKPHQGLLPHRAQITPLVLEQIKHMTETVTALQQC